ncbi:MAG: cation diffusion facilitator family transporter, partial [Thermoplasmata archaeon]
MRPLVILLTTLLLNAALFALNLFVSILSGSRVVLAEAIYAIADLIGSALLVWGLYRSRRPPDHEHPFGFGKERFFWAFMASFVTFTVAGLVVLFTGVERVLSPQPVSDVLAGTVAVGLALLASIGGILVALSELRRSRESVRSLLESAHLGVKTIFLQDVVSVVASGVAFAGIALVAFDNFELADGISACIVGALLLAAGLAISVQ